jgi:hypothetical protein
VFASLNPAHVGAVNIGFIRQCLLRQSLLLSFCTNYSAQPN